MAANAWFLKEDSKDFDAMIFERSSVKNVAKIGSQSNKILK